MITKETNMHSYRKATVISAIGLLLIPFIGLAAGDAPAPKEGGSTNITLMYLEGLMLILLFIIGMLGNTLRQLASVVIDKIEEEKKVSGTTTKALVALLIATLLPAGIFAETPAQVGAPAPQMIGGIASGDFYLIAGFIIFELVIMFSLAYYIHVLLKIISRKPEVVQEAAQAIIRKNWFWDKFNSATAVEKEKDIMLDHDYDGIKELDNALPPWWKYGFYLTIIVAFVYIYRFHVSHDGPSQLEELTEETRQGEADKAEYLAKSANNVDENTVTMLGADGVPAGRELFSKNCVACHLADGGGSVGPNLVDNYWLHGGGVKDVFKSIKYGWQDKGMKSWKDDFSPKQIQELTSFIKSLKGSTPATPKAPQGDLFIESAEVKADSVAPKEVTKK